MDLETLYLLVSVAIRRAETLEDLKAPSAKAAYHEVSVLEEQIADHFPPSAGEGAIARRGAVRAAISAHDFARANRLAQKFIRATGADAEMSAELTGLIHGANGKDGATPRVTMARHPKAVKR
jgi:hypothetical protein